MLFHMMDSGFQLQQEKANIATYLLMFHLQKKVTRLSLDLKKKKESGREIDSMSLQEELQNNAGIFLKSTTVKKCK